MKLSVIAALAGVLSGILFSGAGSAFAQTPQPVDDVSVEASRLEGEVGKYRDISPEAGEALHQLTVLYHKHGRVFGLVRAAHRFVAAHSTDPRHPDVMLKLMDGLEALSRYEEFTVIARQFLTRYPKADHCADVEERLAYSLEKLDEKLPAALAYQTRWKRDMTPTGREFGVKACFLFAQVGTPGVIQESELAEEMFDKLPKDEFARHIGLRSYYEWRRIGQWAKASVVGNKLLKSGLLKDPEERREVLRTMSENYRYLGQHSNAVEVLKQVRAIRDDQFALYYHIQALYDSAAPSAQMEPLVKEYLNKHPDREDRYERIALLGLSWNREKNPERALKLFRSLLGVSPATHSVSSYFIQLNGTEPEKLKDTEAALKQAIIDCEKNNPTQVWRLRYDLAFSLYRDRMQDLSKAKAVLREMLEKSPTNDGHTHNAISWLFTVAETDQEFHADVDRVLKVRRNYPHWASLRTYPASWIKSYRKHATLGDRAAYLVTKLSQADNDPVMQIVAGIRQGASEAREARIREQLAKPEIFNTFNEETKRWVLYDLGYYYQHYSPAAERSKAADYWARLAQMFPTEFDYRFRYLQVATDYGQPEVAKEAARLMLSFEPDRSYPDVWRRIAIAADKNEDADLVRKAVEYARKTHAKFSPDFQYWTSLGDSLQRRELVDEADAVWKHVVDSGSSHYEVRESASRLFQKIEAPQQKIAFSKKLFAADTDYHGRYAGWLADVQIREGDLAGFEATLRETSKRRLNRPFRNWDMDIYALHYMLTNFRSSHVDYRLKAEEENSPASILKVATVIRDVNYDWPSAQGQLVLLEAEAPDARTAMERHLAWQRVTRTVHPDSTRWDYLMPFAQQAILRNDYAVGATLLTGMLENITSATDSRKDAGRAMVGQCYTRLGTVGLTIDENSPIAPLLQAALYLRLGDERLAMETYLDNAALFDKHRDEVPVDLTTFVCDSLMAASGDENHNKVEDIVRSWLVKNSESKTVEEELKAQMQFLLAKNYYGGKRYDVARSEFQTVINRYPETSFAVEAEFGIGETFMAQKVYDQAEKVFEKLAGSQDTDIIVRAEFLRGMLAHRRGDNDEARDIFRSVLERVPNIELANKALFNLSEVYGDEERYMDQLQLLMTVGRLGRVSKRLHAPGLPLSIVVQDSDLGISRGHNRIPVIVRTIPGGDEELVYLTSGGAGKGLFRTDIDTELGPANKGDKVLQLTGNDVIRSDYPDEFKSEFKSVPLSDVEIRIASDARFEVASSKIIDEAEESFSDRLERESREREQGDTRQSQQRPSNQIKPGNPIYLRVKDGDRDLSDIQDTVVAKLVADSGDQVQVTLTETEPHSGIFEGTSKTGELPAGALASDTAIDHSPLMAIDKSPETFWLSEPDGATPKLLTVDMKNLQTVSRVRIHTPRADENKPVRGELQASYDGEFWYRVAAHPQIPNAPRVGEADYGAMQYRVYKENGTRFTSWQQILNLAQGEPLSRGEVTDGQLIWQRPEDEEGRSKYYSVVWFGKFVQPRAGAVRFSIQGYRTALAVNDRLEMEPGVGNRTADVWLEAGTHDLTIFAAAFTNTATMSAQRARADLNRQRVVLSPFLSGDFDLSGANESIVAAMKPVGASEPAASADKSVSKDGAATITLDLESVQFEKNSEQFGIHEQNKGKAIGNWKDLADAAFWEFETATPGVYDVWLEYSHAGGGSQFRVEFGDQGFSSTVSNTGNWTTFRQDRFGTVVVNEAGKAKLAIRPLVIQGGGTMDLRSVELRPASGSRVILADKAWEFRFAPINVRFTRFVINEYLGEAVAVNHVEVSGEDVLKPYIPTETDVLALSDNDQLEIAGGDVVKATYTDEVTQANSGGSRLIAGQLQATYFNGTVAPIAYDFVRERNGSVTPVRKRLKRVDPGDRLIVEITDYDRDQSVTRDKLQFQVSVNDGEPVTLTATETEDNSGVFTKEVDTGTQAEGDRLVVAAGDRVNIRYLDEQNTFPGHSVPRESVVYVSHVTGARLRILESRVIPARDGSARPQQFVYQVPDGETKVTNVAFEAPLTIEVIDPDAARDSRSEVIAKVTTSDGATVDVRCVVSSAFLNIPREEAEEYALEEGRFIGQIAMQLGSKSSPVIVPVTAEMPRNLIGGGKLQGDGEEGETSEFDDGLVVAVLNLSGKDRITATYNDERKPKGSTAIVSALGRLISNGELASLDRNYDEPVERLHVGEKLFLMVTDADQDSSDERDTVTIQVTTEFGEKEEFQLVETLAHSGVFNGSLTLKSNNAPKSGNIDMTDPAIECYFGDTITVTYLDPTASTEEGRLERNTQLPVVIGTDGLISAFSKTFNNETLAVETKFHVAESYFELFKSHKNLGRKDEETIDLAAGRRVLREVIEDFPDPKYQPRILYLLGQFAQELGDSDEATSAYEQIVSQFPEHPLAADAQYKLAQTYEEAGDFDEALEAYVTLAATYPRSPLIANVMIRISDHFYKNEEFPIAAEVGKKFLEKFEGHQFASRMAFRVGQCFYKAEKFTTAGDSFDLFAKTFPDDELAADSMFWSGESFRMAKNDREAFRRYNRCRWDFPASDAAKYARGRLALPEMLRQFEVEANAVENDN
ncbi:MAG: tetratricopeptide repeat protein [Rhodopirellula sp.]|nr:tetratricopeptide repeat protein [Rhodopirellula sp.]